MKFGDHLESCRMQAFNFTKMGLPLTHIFQGVEVVVHRPSSK